MNNGEYTNDRIKDYINAWYACKNKISELNKQCENAKNHVENYMITNNKNKLEYKGIIIKRRKGKRKVIIKKNIPIDIWNRYSNDIEYEIFTISKPKSKINNK